MNRRTFIKNTTIITTALGFNIIEAKKIDKPKQIELFTKEEIEAYGFIYEPDITKCKMGKTRFHYNGSHIDKTGNVIHSPSVIELGQTTEKQLKEDVAFSIYYKYIHSIFVNIPETIIFDHVHNKVMYLGHTSKPLITGRMNYRIGKTTIDRDEYWNMTDANRQAFHDKHNPGSKAMEFDMKFAKKHNRKV